MTAAADRLRALAKGPALNLPPVHWEAPTVVTDGPYPITRWGALPWTVEPGAARVPRVYLYACSIKGTEGPFFDVGGERYTVAEARALLDRLASAIAMAEELPR